MRRVIALVLTALTLAGCHTVTEGNVTGVWFESAHDEWRQGPCTYMVKGVCYVHASYTEHVPDRCWLDLTDEEGTTRYLIDCAHKDDYVIGSRVAAK